MWQHHARVHCGTETFDTVTTGSVKTHMISSSDPGQLSLLSSVGRELSTSQHALQQRSKGRLRMHVWVAGKLCDSLLTRAIPERLRDEL